MEYSRNNFKQHSLLISELLQRIDELGSVRFLSPISRYYLFLEARQVKQEKTNDQMKSRIIKLEKQIENLNKHFEDILQECESFADFMKIFEERTRRCSETVKWAPSPRPPSYHEYYHQVSGDFPQQGAGRPVQGDENCQGRAEGLEIQTEFDAEQTRDEYWRPAPVQGISRMEWSPLITQFRRTPRGAWVTCWGWWLPRCPQSRWCPGTTWSSSGQSTLCSSYRPSVCPLSLLPVWSCRVRLLIRIH